jgi:hypothetical protein
MPWFHWSYESPVELVLQNGVTIQGSEGTCQGDPASPLWYSLNLQPVLNHIVDTWGRDGWLSVVRAFLDDGVFAGPIHILLEIIHYLRSPDVRQRGLDLRLDKCVLYVPFQGVQEIRSTYGVRREVPIVTDGCIVLGCPLSISDEFVQLHNLRIAADVQRFCQSLTQLSSAQSSMVLLRLCAGPTKVNHILRCLPPRLTQDLAKNMDDAVEHALRVTLELGERNLTDAQWTQAKLPMSMSGLGLISSSLVKEAAYLGSVGQ